MFIALMAFQALVILLSCLSLAVPDEKPSAWAQVLRLFLLAGHVAVASALWFGWHRS